jgi:hypothetical protein
MKDKSTAEAKAPAFVKASGPRKYTRRKAKLAPVATWLEEVKQLDGSIVLTVTRLGSGISVRADWPLHAVHSSAAWLREVLA